jgi:phytoene synthase
MTVEAYTWEAKLLDQAQFAAYQATHQARRAVETVFAPFDNPGLLDRAYRYCESVTAFHSRTFHLASGLLPEAKRRAARALYAFCRTSDDLVDRALGDARPALEAWGRRALNPQPISEQDALDDSDALTILAWTDTRGRYHVPLLYAQQLIEGVSADLGRVRYETFDELAEYCYRVASTVGLMSMHIIGYSGPEAIPYAIRLGVALQMTNILRDVGEDWRNGRLYLPRQELAAFGLSEADLVAGRVDDRWREFMRFQIERTRRLYHESWPGIRMLDTDGRFAIAAAAQLYRAILEDIEDHDYDNFTRRAHIGTLGKLRRLLGVWWATR